MNNLLPFFTYYGGKWRSVKLYPTPKFGTIIEPFAGAAGYSLHYPEKNIILIEKNPKIAALWDYLIHVKEYEILSLPLLNNFDCVDDFQIINEAKTLIGFWLNKGSASPCKHPSSWMRGGTRPNSYWGANIRNRIAEQVSKIRHWKIICSDYQNFSIDYESTYFIDPPYSTKAGRLYTFNKINYSYLASWCKNLNGQIIVCEQEGANWLPFNYLANIKTNESSRGKKISSEVIWTN